MRGTVHKYDWCQIGGAVKHPEEGKVFDVSVALKEATDVKDAYCKVYPVSGYGNEEILRNILKLEKPDAIMHFTDPRFWGWLYSMEHELRQTMPLMYLNIWDDLPYPHWNENFYDCCDLLMAISKQTYNINREVCRRTPRIEGKDLFYVQHGINTEEYFPVDPSEKEYLDFKKVVTNDKDYDFIALFNSRNIHRKRPGDLIVAYTRFCESLTKEQSDKCLLILHTDPVDVHGTDLPAVVRNLCPFPVAFSDKKIPINQLNYLYNIADVTCCPSSAEGFGLSHMEAMMAGSPTITTVIGGLQDQMGFKVDGKDITTDNFTAKVPSNSTGKISKEHGEWVYPLWPEIGMQGSPQTPYIYDSRPTIPDIVKGLEHWYNMGRDESHKKGLVGRKWAIENGFCHKGMGDAALTAIDTCFETFTPRDKYTIINTKQKPVKYNRGILV